jgi:hypothetical protein
MDSDGGKPNEEGGRIALAFFGLVRYGSLTVDSVEKNIVGVLRSSGIRFDSFCHANDVESIHNPRSNELHVPVKDAAAYARLLGRTVCRVEAQATHIDPQFDAKDYATHGDPWKDGCVSLQNLLRQLYSLRRVTTMWSQSGVEYDAVLCLRSDLVYTDPLDVDALRWVMAAAGGGDASPRLVVPLWQPHSGMNDRFAMGSPAAMRVYGSRFDAALAYSKTVNLHSERFLKSTMLAHAEGMAVRHTCQAASRVRATGVLHPEDTRAAKLLLHPIYVLLLCRNQEAALARALAHYGRCLPTATLLVYEHHSTDRTRDVARQYHAQVRALGERGLDSLERVKQYAATAFQQPCWVFCVDADELVEVDTADLLREQRRGTLNIRVRKSAVSKFVGFHTAMAFIRERESGMKDLN